MRLPVLITCICFFCMSSQAQNFGGNPASVDWKQINTKKIRVIFPAGLDSQARRVANVVKLMADSTSVSIGGKLKKWNLLLQNQTTIPNAYVRMAPLMSELYMTPSQDNFSVGSIRWDDNLAIHESRHIQQFSNFNNGLTRVFSFLLGQEGQLLANGITIPDYFFEGDAVWQETLVSEQGRGRMPSFYNGIRSLWLGNKNYSWMKLRSGSLKDYTPDHYQLGYLLIAYGYEKYGEKFWSKVTHDAVQFKGLFYSFNKAIERHAGVSYIQFRSDAMQHFKTRSMPVHKTVQAHFVTVGEKNNVVNYEYPHFISKDSVLVTKKSNNAINAFYILAGGKEKKIRVRDLGLDEYYSYRNGRVVYTGFQTDPRWANRDYSVINILDIYTGQQQQLSLKSRYFSPDMLDDGSEILAVAVKPDGTNQLHRLNVKTGDLIAALPNEYNLFYTQTKYIDNNTAVSAVRLPQGTMCLIKTDLQSGKTDFLTPASYNVVGYPFVKGDTVLFTAMHELTDKVFAVRLSDRRLYQVTDNHNGFYHPVADAGGQLLVSAFTADGFMLAKIDQAGQSWKAIQATEFSTTPVNYFPATTDTFTGAHALTRFDADQKESDGQAGQQHLATNYRKTKGLFNVHSWRPIAEDPEFGYAFYSDNVLSSFSNAASYTYNRADRSHTIGIGSAFAGWFPVLQSNVELSFNRTVDTAVGKSVSFNAAKASVGFSIPLRFIGGRTNKFVNFGGGYNIEQFFYRGVGKNILNNRSIDYLNGFFNFSNVNQVAAQHINPRWAQSVSISYRDAVNFRNSHKLVANGAVYFPGLHRNHSLVITGSYQKRDTLADLFSKNFNYTRGYEALSTRRMYKAGINYHLPLLYPDWGFGNIIFIQRIRANAFFDYTNARARVNGLLTEILNRSAGTELYFDTKIWNALPLSFGVRFTRLLDTDLLNPLVRNRWEILIPLNIIPE